MGVHVRLHHILAGGEEEHLLAVGAERPRPAAGALDYPVIQSATRALERPVGPLLAVRRRANANTAPLLQPRAVPQPQPVTVAAVGDGAQVVPLPLPAGEELAGPGVPELDCPLPAADRHPLAVRAEGSALPFVHSRIDLLPVDIARLVGPA